MQRLSKGLFIPFRLKNIIWDTILTFPGIQRFLEVGSQPGSKRRVMRHEKCKQAQIGKTRVIAIELIIHGISKRFFDKKMVPYHISYKLITQDLPLHLLVICIIQSVVKLAPERHWCIHTQLSRSLRWCSHLWHCRSKSHNILKSFMLRFQAVFAKLHDPYHCHSEAFVCDLIEKAPWMLFSIKPLWGHLCEKKAR